MQMKSMLPTTMDETPRGAAADAPARRAGPFFSVVVAACDVEPYLRECLDSVTDQPFRDWECVVFAEASKDGTERIARGFAEKDARFRVYSGPRTGSCSVPRNRGAAEARGAYVLFLDGDDMLADGALGRVAARIRALPGADMYQGAIRVVDGKTGAQVELRDNYPPDATAPLSGAEATLLSARRAGLPCPMLQMTAFRRGFLSEHGLVCVPGLRRQDSEFSPRALYLARAVVPIHEPFYVYRLQPASVSSSARGHGYFLPDWGVICQSLLSFAADEAAKPGFDRRVAACWAGQWIPRAFYLWFSPDAIRSIPREKRLSTFRVAVAGRAADGFRLLAGTLPRAKRLACRAALAFAEAPVAAWAVEWFFRAYFALAKKRRRGEGGAGAAPRPDGAPAAAVSRRTSR